MFVLCWLKQRLDMNYIPSILSFLLFGYPFFTSSLSSISLYPFFPSILPPFFASFFSLDSFLPILSPFLFFHFSVSYIFIFISFHPFLSFFLSFPFFYLLPPLSINLSCIYQSITVSYHHFIPTHWSNEYSTTDHHLSRNLYSSRIDESLKTFLNLTIRTQWLYFTFLLGG